MKPKKGGSPAIESAASATAAAVSGIARASPATAGYSRAPAPFSIMPTARKSPAL